MSIDSIKEQISKLGDDDYQEVMRWVITTEKQRRDAQPAIEQAQAEIISELQEAGKIEKPAAATEIVEDKSVAEYPAWENPGTDHSKMYHLGDIVQYDGKLVESTHQGLNHWEPGTLGYDGRIWRDVTPTQAEPVEPTEPDEGGDTITAWVPGIPATVGMLVKYDSDVYRVLQPHTTAAHWPPNAAHSLYQKQN